MLIHTTAFAHVHPEQVVAALLVAAIAFGWSFLRQRRSQN